MEINEKLKIIRLELCDTFLGNISREIIDFVTNDRHLMCVDVSNKQGEEKIILKCEYQKGFVGRKPYQYITLLPFEIKSDDVYISENLNWEYVTMLEKVNKDKKINKKGYIQEYLDWRFPKQRIL